VKHSNLKKIQRTRKKLIETFRKLSRHNDVRGTSGCLATPNENCGLRILDDRDSSHSLVFSNVFCIALGAFLIKILTLLWSCKRTAPRTLMIQHSCFQKDGLKSTCLTSATDCSVEGISSTPEIPSIKCKFSLPVVTFVLKLVIRI